MPVTIDDIVQQLGIARSTVSRALRNHPRISQKTRERVQEVARELGYIPNEVARSLTTSRTLSLGMVITHIADPWIWQVADGVEQVAAEHGYSIFLRMARGDGARELAIIEDFQRRRVDGIVIASSHLVASYSEQLSSIRIPIIVINNQIQSEHLVTVRIDDATAACIAVDHLLALGHSRIGYIGAIDRPISNETRAQAYAQVLQACGLQPRPIHVDGGKARRGDFAYGRLAGHQLSTAGVSAVFCYNDAIAAGVIAALHERNIKVPTELSVIGFDDIDLAENTIPPLTTVRQPKFDLGRLAAMTILAMIEGQPVKSTVLPCELVVRGSTDVFRPVA